MRKKKAAILLFFVQVHPRDNNNNNRTGDDENCFDNFSTAAFEENNFVSYPCTDGTADDKD